MDYTNNVQSSGEVVVTERTDGNTTLVLLVFVLLIVAGVFVYVTSRSQTLPVEYVPQTDENQLSGNDDLDVVAEESIGEQLSLLAATSTNNTIVDEEVKQQLDALSATEEAVLPTEEEVKAYLQQLSE